MLKRRREHLGSGAVIVGVVDEDAAHSAPVRPGVSPGGKVIAEFEGYHRLDCSETASQLSLGGDRSRY